MTATTSTTTRRTLVTFVLGALAFTAGLTAQSKPAITRADYGQWETLAVGGGGRGGGGGGFSPDGQWIAYGINRTSRSNELRVTKIADASTKTFAFGGGQTFSFDSKWLAYSITQSEAEQERLRAAQSARAELARHPESLDGRKHDRREHRVVRVQRRRQVPRDAAVSAGASGARRLAAAHSAPGRGAAARGGGAPGDATEDRPGATLTVRDLASGRDTTFGNVSEFDWQDADRTHLLAMVISAEGKVGNGVQLFDPETTVLRVLDSSATTYTGLSWRRNAPDLAVLRAQTDDRHDGPTHAILAWTGVGSAGQLRTYDPSKDATFPAGMRTVSFRRLTWSDDGKTIVLGYAKWDDKPPTPGRARRPAARSADSTAERRRARRRRHLALDGSRR